ncbi:MAG: hypothetical protein KDD55_04555 [Bdellovibrionales bacterium]|nr:hypothetical protein [Bdellovibrionales bacterium]
MFQPDRSLPKSADGQSSPREDARFSSLAHSARTAIQQHPLRTTLGVGTLAVLASLSLRPSEDPPPRLAPATPERFDVDFPDATNLIMEEGEPHRHPITPDEGVASTIPTATLLAEYKQAWELHRRSISAQRQDWTQRYLLMGQNTFEDVQINVHGEPCTTWASHLLETHAIEGNARAQLTNLHKSLLLTEDIDHLSCDLITVASMYLNEDGAFLKSLYDEDPGIIQSWGPSELLAALTLIPPSTSTDRELQEWFERFVDLGAHFEISLNSHPRWIHIGEAPYLSSQTFWAKGSKCFSLDVIRANLEDLLLSSEALKQKAGIQILFSLYQGDRISLSEVEEFLEGIPTSPAPLYLSREAAGVEFQLLEELLKKQDFDRIPVHILYRLTDARYPFSVELYSILEAEDSLKESDFDYFFQDSQAQVNFMKYLAQAFTEQACSFIERHKDQILSRYFQQGAPEIRLSSLDLALTHNLFAGLSAESIDDSLRLLFLELTASQQRELILSLGTTDGALAESHFLTDVASGIYPQCDPDIIALAQEFAR